MVIGSLNKNSLQRAHSFPLLFFAIFAVFAVQPIFNHYNIVDMSQRVQSASSRSTCAKVSNFMLTGCQFAWGGFIH